MDLDSLLGPLVGAGRAAPVHAVLVTLAARELPPRPDVREARALWQAVLSGRWGVVAQIERDGRRCFVIRRMRPTEPTRPRLTAREHAIAGAASHGCSNKQISIDLGLCSSTVATLLTSATRKLGLASRETLLHAFAVLAPPAPAVDAEPAGEPERAVWVTHLHHDGDDYAALWLALTPRLPPSLTAAEREVATLVVAGLSNAAIAERRHTSVRTVANQLRAIFTKLAIDSRRQLRSRYSLRAAPVTPRG